MVMPNNAAANKYFMWIDLLIMYPNRAPCGLNRSDLIEIE